MKRYKWIVGKQMGHQVYVHKKYAKYIIPDKLLKNAKKQAKGFNYNCIMWDKKTKAIRFDSAYDFDTAREPHVGKYLTVDYYGKCTYGHSNAIWHHKWLWVKDSYKRFDVKESKLWSDAWQNKFNESAKGTDKTFNEQLRKYGLEKYIEQRSETVILSDA